MAAALHPQPQLSAAALVTRASVTRTDHGTPPAPGGLQRRGGGRLARLPDALLERILGLLLQPDRHRAALVSRRWHAAAHAPEALHDVSRFFTIKGLASFAAWLRRHGQRVRSLDMTSIALASSREDHTWELAACLAACAAAAAGSLRSLKLDVSVFGIDRDSSLCVTSWCAALRQLKSLELRAARASGLRITNDLAGLTALTRLLISGRSVAVQPRARLPPAVERLMLRDKDSTALPHQLSGLTRLSVLVLHTTCCEPEEYAVLTSLGQLASLELYGSKYLPTCLPQLTTLQELNLREASEASEPAAAAAAVDGVLHQLTQLTSLCIANEPERCVVPAALAGLSRLQRCCLGSAHYGAADRPQSSLPPGRWAAGLSSLGVSAELLAQSLAVLSSATHLTRLAVTGGNFKQPRWAAFWEWAQHHTSLQQLQVDVGEDDELPGSILRYVCCLAQGRPGLRVTMEIAGDGRTFDDEFDIAV